MIIINAKEYIFYMKTRFCPSPTGNLHLGNVRTALFNALLAHQSQGTFLLRIEDTDKMRSDDRYTRQLMEDLHWLGLDWHEGPEIGGAAAPYWQSQRQAIYDQFYEKLAGGHQAYPCFCSEQHLNIMRKIQLSSGIAPRYDGTCRHLTPEQINAKLAEGLKPTLRFRVPDNEIIAFDDIVRGQQRFQSNDLGDFIIRRADGTPPFMFCNAIDDALMGVTHVLRGEDHLTNTPRQILILKSFALPIPRYGHISLIMALDGGPLSKRLGSLSIKDMRKEGYFPQAIVNYLARLGHFYSSHEYMSLSELANKFDLNALSGAPAKYDPSHLLHWQKLAVMHTSDEELYAWLGPEVEHLVPSELKTQFLTAIRPNCVFPADGRHLAQRLFAAELIFSDEDIVLLRSAGEAFFKQALTAVDQHGMDIKSIYQNLTETLGVKGQKLFQPLRVALTAELKGPEMHFVFPLLGIDRIKDRLHAVLRII